MGRGLVIPVSLPSGFRKSASEAFPGETGGTAQ